MLTKDTPNYYHLIVTQRQLSKSNHVFSEFITTVSKEKGAITKSVGLVNEPCSSWLKADGNNRNGSKSILNVGRKRSRLNWSSVVGFLLPIAALVIEYSLGDMVFTLSQHNCIVDK